MQQVRSAQEEDGENYIAAQGGQNEVQEGDHSLTPQQAHSTAVSKALPSQSQRALMPGAEPSC